MGLLSRKKRLDEEEQEEQDLEQQDEIDEEELESPKAKPKPVQASSNKINKQEVSALISFHLQKAYNYFELYQSLA